MRKHEDHKNYTIFISFLNNYCDFLFFLHLNIILGLAFILSCLEVPVRWQFHHFSFLFFP